MILDRQALNLNEIQKIIENLPESEKRTQMEVYLKKFLKTKPEKAKRIKEDLKALDLLKIKNEHIVKIIDLMPKDVSDINKIFTDVSLTEDETNKILDVINKK